jgi:hypothetical protein
MNAASAIDARGRKEARILSAPEADSEMLGPKTDVTTLALSAADADSATDADDSNAYGYSVEIGVAEIGEKPSIT